MFPLPVKTEGNDLFTGQLAHDHRGDLFAIGGVPLVQEWILVIHAEGGGVVAGQAYPDFGGLAAIRFAQQRADGGAVFKAAERHRLGAVFPGAFVDQQVIAVRRYIHGAGAVVPELTDWLEAVGFHARAH